MAAASPSSAPASTAEGELDITNAKAMDPNIVQEFAGYGVR